VEGGTPAYCVHALLKCATRVVQAPSAVFRGLRREGRLRDGMAFCGNPKRAYGNDGQSIDTNLDGLIFVVYADDQGYVFDWDWTQADPSDPSVPRDASQRFVARVPAPSAVLIGVENLRAGSFKSGPWHSCRGDCIFYCISDAPSYATRVNDELTVFLSFGESSTMTGCKMKNVSRIWNDVRQNDRVREDPKTNVPLVSFLANSYAVQALNGHDSHYAALIKHAGRFRGSSSLNELTGRVGRYYLRPSLRLESARSPNRQNWQFGVHLAS
jgi:hypothetical protein